MTLLRSRIGLTAKHTVFNTAQVHYPRYMSEPAVGFVSALLRHDESDRLGSGPTSKADVKTHRFFSGESIGVKTFVKQAFGGGEGEGRRVGRGEEGVLQFIVTSECANVMTMAMTTAILSDMRKSEIGRLFEQLACLQATKRI